MLQKVVEILGKCNAAINCQNVVKPVVRYINTTLHLEQWNGGTVKQCQRHRLKLTKNSSSIDFEQHKPVLIPMQSIFRSEYEWCHWQFPERANIDIGEKLFHSCVKVEVHPMLRDNSERNLFLCWWKQISSRCRRYNFFGGLEFCTLVHFKSAACFSKLLTHKVGCCCFLIPPKSTLTTLSWLLQTAFEPDHCKLAETSFCKFYELIFTHSNILRKEIKH